MLKGKYVQLRIMDSTDAEYVRQLRNSPQIASYFSDSYFLSDLRQKKFVESLATDTTRQMFIAEHAETHEPFGVFSLIAIDHRNQRAATGVFVDQDQAGRGLHAFEADFLLFQYSFQNLNLQKLTAAVLAFNTRARRWNEAVGMQQEGILRRHDFSHGAFQDVILYGLLRDDFYNRPTKAMQVFFKNTTGSQAPEELREDQTK